MLIFGAISWLALTIKVAVIVNWFVSLALCDGSAGTGTAAMSHPHHAHCLAIMIGQAGCTALLRKGAPIILTAPRCTFILIFTGFITLFLLMLYYCIKCLIINRFVFLRVYFAWVFILNFGFIWRLLMNFNISHGADVVSINIWPTY